MAGFNHSATASVIIDGKQAEAELKKLKEDTLKWRAELLRARDVKDFPAIAKAEGELKRLKNETTEVTRRTRVYGEVLNNLSTAPINKLRQAQRELTKELENTTRGTEKYASKEKDLNRVREQLAKIKAEQNGLTTSQGNFFTKATDGFNKYFGLATTAIAGLTGIALGFKSTVAAFNDFESGAQELSAITELEGTDLDFLKNKAKEFSVSVSDDGVRITKSATDILTAFKIMGGAKAELLGNKEALAAVTYEALVLAEATKMDTATAVESLATTMNQFGASADEARRYINALAAGSTAGAAEVNDISASMVKMGTVASQANISVEESVGMLETLAEKGVKAEIAGTQLKTVLLKLQTGADQFNPAIVGMSKALANLDAANLSAEESTNMFGLESVVAANILIKNRDKYDELTKAVTGTNTAYEQAGKNSDTATAKLGQAKNQINLNAIALGERLSPAMTFSTNLFSKFLEVTVKFLDWTSRNAELVGFLARLIGVLTVSVVSYTAAKKLITLWTSNYNKASILEIATEKLKSAGMVIARGATFAYAAAKALLTGNIQRATVAMRAFSMATKMSPVGIVVGVITAAVAAFMLFKDSQDEVIENNNALTESTKNYNKKVAEETGEIGALFYQLKQTNPQSAERIRLINKINSEYGTTLKNLKDEKAFTDQLTEAYDKLIYSMMTRIAVESQQEALSVAIQKQIELKTRIVELNAALEDQQKLQDAMAEATGGTESNQGTLDLLSDLEQAEAELKIVTASFDKIYNTTQKVIDDINAEKNKNKTTPTSTAADEIIMTPEELEARKKAAEERNKFRKQEDERSSKLLEDYRKKVLNQLIAIENQRKAHNERELDEIREKYNEELLVAEANALLNGKNAEQWETISNQLILNRNEDLNLKRAEQEKRFAQSIWNARKEAGKIGLTELEEAEQSALEEQYAKQEIGLEEFLLRQQGIIDKYQKIRLDKEKEHAEEIIAVREQYDLISSDEKMKTELDKLKEHYTNKLLTDTEYEKAKAEIIKKYTEQRVDTDKAAWKKQLDIAAGYVQQAQMFIGAVSDFFSAAKELELEKAGDNEEKKKAINKKYADVEMGIKIAQIAAATALAIINAIAQLGPIAGGIAGGFIAVTGGLQAALAVRQRNKIRGFEEGYYPISDHRGRKFNARRGGKPSTQIVDRPTMFLTGEQGKSFPEMIIDGTTFKNLQINSPEAIEAIYNARDGYRGYEEGFYPTKERVEIIKENSTMYSDPRLIAVLERLLEEGVSLEYTKIKKMKEKEDNIRNKFTPVRK